MARHCRPAKLVLPVKVAPSCSSSVDDHQSCCRPHDGQVGRRHMYRSRCGVAAKPRFFASRWQKVSSNRDVPCRSCGANLASLRIASACRLELRARLRLQGRVHIAACVDCPDVAPTLRVVLDRLCSNARRVRPWWRAPLRPKTPLCMSTTEDVMCCASRTRAWWSG